MRDFHGNTSYAKYNIFHVADEKDSYRLHVDQFSGNAGKTDIENCERNIWVGR